MATDWQDLTVGQKIEAVRPLVEGQGLSNGQAAARLGVSRNAVISVVTRSRTTAKPIRTSLTGQPRVGGQVSTMQQKVRRARKAPAKPAKRPSFNAAPQFDGGPAAPAWADAWLPLPGSTPQPLEQHREHECRWPVYDGNQPRLFCCLPVAGEARYCAAHQALGTRPVPPKAKP